jgi:hypothetical protein
MKRILSLLTLVVVAVSFSSCSATTDKATASPAAIAAVAAETDAKIEQEIIQLENEATDIAIKRDVRRLEQMLAGDTFITDLNGKVFDKAGLLTQVKNDPYQWESITNSEYKVRIYRDVVVVTYLTTGSGKLNGQPVKGQARSTDTWVKQKGQWKLAVSQGTIVEGSVVMGKP